MSEYTYDKNRPGDQSDDQSVSSADPSSQVPLTQNPASHEAPSWGDDDEWSLRSSSVEEDDPLIKLAKLMELNQQQEPAPVPVTVPLAPAPDEIIQSASLPTQVAADLVGETPYQAPAETYVAPEPELVMPQFSPPATPDVPASAGLSAPVLPTAELARAPAAALAPEPAPASDGQIHDPFAPGGSGKIPEPTDFDVSRMPRAIRPVAAAGISPLSGVQGQAGADLVQAAVEAQAQPAAPAIPVAPQPAQYSAPIAPKPAELPPIQAASVMPAPAALDPFLNNPVAPAPIAPAPTVAAPPVVTPPLAAASVAAPPVATMPEPAAIQPAAELTAAAPAPDFSYLREVEDLRVPSPAEKAAAEAAAQAELPGVVHMPNEVDVDLADEDYDDVDLDDGGLFANRGMMVAAGVVAFVVLGGAALLAYQAIFTGGDNSPPPLLLASKDAVRILPDGQSADGGLTSSAGALSENGSPSDGGTLLSRSEQPVTSLNPNINGDRVARVILPNPANGSANQTRLSPTSEPLGPRPVKTFIVRPDGSIVNNTPTNNSRNTNSVIKPRTVRTQVITNSGSPAAVVTNNLQLATAGPIPRVRPGSNGSNSAASTGGGSRATLPVAPRVSIGTQPVNNSSPTFNTAAPAVVKPVQPAAAPAQKPAPVQLAATTSGDFVVQVSSQRSLAAAESAYAGLKRRFPTVLASVGPDIARADLGARGIYYRVRVGPMQTRGEAAEFCNRLKNAGGDCIVARR